MKTDSKLLRALEARLVGLSGDEDVSLPAAFLAGIVRDLNEATSARAHLDDVRAQLDRLRSGGEEYVE